MSLFSEPQLLEGHRWRNKRIGLLGGSFNPPHAGHVHISLSALRLMNLDCIWWLVSPQNPLKSQKPLSVAQRIEMSRSLVQHPNILVTGLEDDLGTNITLLSVQALKRYFPSTNFLWISGMDNAHSLHEWHAWQDLLKEISMLHIARPPVRGLVKRSPLRLYGRQKHVFIDRPAAYDLSPEHTYWAMREKMVDLSSSDVRNKMI